MLKWRHPYATLKSFWHFYIILISFWHPFQSRWFGQLCKHRLMLVPAEWPFECSINSPSENKHCSYNFITLLTFESNKVNGKITITLAITILGLITNWGTVLLKKCTVMARFFLSVFLFNQFLFKNIIITLKC